MSEMIIRKLHSTFVPIDPAGYDLMEKLEPNSVYRVKLVKNRALNSDDVTDEQRTVAQNRLYRAWLSDMSRTNVNEYAGHDEKWWDRAMKKRLLVAIYERDSQDYAELVQSVRAVRDAGLKAEAERIFNHVVSETSTTRASVAQFREYLDKIERQCHALGISLRTDAGLYALAMNQ